MTQFGASFGKEAFGGDPFGLSAQLCVDRMLGALERFRGVVPTLALLTAPVDSEITLALLQEAPLPGIFVGYTGSSFDAASSNGLIFNQRMTFSLLCAASSLRDRVDRLAGGTVYQPGLWNLCRWAAFYGARALWEMRQPFTVRPESERFVTYDAARFVGIVELSVLGQFDLYADAETEVRLERLGIVHSPSNVLELFGPDNVTPNTADPTSLPGPGVAELEE